MSSIIQISFALFITVSSCLNTAAQNTGNTKAADFYKVNSTRGGNSWQLVKKSGSAFKIRWFVNNSAKETTKEFESDLAERFHLVMENADFVVLSAPKDRDEWLDVCLPLTGNQKEVYFKNALAYDAKNNFVVIEESGDTVMKIVNLKNRQEQPILERPNDCSTVYNHHCFDSISFADSTLVYRWILPNRIQPAKFYEKKVKATF